MTHTEALELLAEAGFDNGWALADGVLVYWEHDIDPPSPLVRPSEASAPADNSPK
jgi:hypothetical protein